ASREGYAGQIQRVVVYRDKTARATLALSARSNETELLGARKALLEAQTDGALALGARRVAELMHVRFVVLVRPDDAAVYDNSKSVLASFAAVPMAVEQV